MKESIPFLTVAAIVIGCVAIGAWLVVQGHPGFGLFAMIIGASTSYSTDAKRK